VKKEESDIAEAVEPGGAFSADLPLNGLHRWDGGKLRARHPHP